MIRWALVLVVACSGRERAAPPKHDDAPRAPADVSIDAAPIPRADTSWMTSHDFDGDGKRDLVDVAYSGGAHCCYKLAVTLSTTQHTIAIPFELDGGYVGGLTLERPENFTIEIREGVAMLVMAIAGYNGRPQPIPLEWTKAYGVRSHRIRVDVRTGQLHVENLGWSCAEATDALVHRAFDAWEGWPASCSYAEL